MKYHLAILAPGWTDLILDGSKTIESRFTKVRCAPFGKVHEDDVVYLKESGGLVKGMFTVAKVETFENLTDAQICDLFYKEYREQIFSDLSASMQRPPEKWLTAKHATLFILPILLLLRIRFPISRKDGQGRFPTRETSYR